MKRIAIIACLGLLGGCGKKKAQEGLEPLQYPEGSAGSAAGAASNPPAGEAIAKRFDECWSMWSAGKFDDFKGCFTNDATREVPGSGRPVTVGPPAIVDSTKGMPDQKCEPVLELVNGHNLAAVVLVTATQTAPLDGPSGPIAATNKKTGVLLGQVLEFADAGHAKHESDFFDLATLLGQVSPVTGHPVRAALDKAPMAKEVVIAKHDDKEQANLEATKATQDAFNKHDLKAFGDHLTDDVVWSEAPQPADWNKQEAIQHAQDAWKAFSDMKISATASWAAGDYVVVVATMDGTNDGAMPAMGIKQATKKKFSVPFLAIHKLDGGKVKATWVFDQGLAFAQQLSLLPPPPPHVGDK
jgi:ketosteroid isomerase-like protein